LVLKVSYLGPVMLVSRLVSVSKILAETPALVHAWAK